MIQKMFALLAIAALCAPAWAQYNCSGTPNTKPVWTAAPVFVRKTTNGALYQAGDAVQNISVVHLYGSAYELG